MGRGVALAALVCTPLVLSGCAPAEKRTDGSSASSLVYSPGERITAERQAAAARPAAGDGLRTGVRCRVHLRRDAVGMAGQAPLTIVGTSMISERAALVGTIERIDTDALVIHAEGSTYWVPRDMILAVEFPDERRP